MAKTNRSDLEKRIIDCRQATITGENTAIRVFQIILDLLDSVPTEFDTKRPYAQGSWIIWNGRLVTAVFPTLAGQSPESHPAKWKDNVIDDAAELVDGGPNLPVLAEPLREYIAQLIKPGTGTGDGTGVLVPRASTDAEFSAGVSTTTFVTPKQVAGLLADILELIDAIGDGTGTGGTAKTPTWQQTTDEPGGNVTTKDVKARSYTQEYRDSVDDVHVIYAGINQGLGANGKPVDQLGVPISKQKLGQIALYEAPSSALNDFMLRIIDVMSPEVARLFDLKLPASTTGNGSTAYLRPVFLGCIEEPVAGSTASQTITIQNPKQDQEVPHVMTAGPVIITFQSFNSATIVPINSNHVRIHFDEGVIPPAELSFKLDYKNAV